MMNKVKKIILPFIFMLLIGLLPRNADANKYEYDALNRLTRVVYDEATSIEYTYDAAGNRTRKVVKGPLSPDINHSGIVNFIDFAILAQDWLKSSDHLPGDLNRDDIVDVKDLKIMADYWLHPGEHQPPNPDINHSGMVNFIDFAIFASHWLEEECGYMNEWCAGADINWSTTVDFDDLAILAQHWLESVP
jgi:YD repeat-containing protein